MPVLPISFLWFFFSLLSFHSFLGEEQQQEWGSFNVVERNQTFHAFIRNRMYCQLPESGSVELQLPGYNDVCKLCRLHRLMSKPSCPVRLPCFLDFRVNIHWVKVTWILHRLRDYSGLINSSPSITTLPFNESFW